MIELSDISFAYGQSDFALSVESLSIGKGETVAIVGPSGSGKTTLLHLMAGILVPKRGHVRFDGQAMSSISDKGRRRVRLTQMGMVFQGIELIDYLSARDNVLLPYRIDSALTLDAQAKQRANELLQRVGLDGAAGRAVSGLSQGERQRVGLCRALIANPSVVLADEPTAALDEDSTSTAMDLLMQLVAERSATLVMLTHDRSLLPRFDRVVTVDRGRLSEGVS